MSSSTGHVLTGVGIAVYIVFTGLLTGVGIAVHVAFTGFLFLFVHHLIHDFREEMPNQFSVTVRVL